jgi:AcrR family transcriptional regulator
MPKVLPEYLALRRQQILDASAACFSRRGFHATTMQDICKEADLSPGAVYRYFPSKESIIEAMCDHSSTTNLEAIKTALAESGNTWEAFTDLIRRFFTELEALKTSADCALNVELIAEAPRNESIREWLTGSLEATYGLFLDLIAAAQARGEVDPSLNPRSVAQVMVGLYHGFVTQKLVEPDIDVEGYAAVLRGLFGGSFWLGAPESANGSAATSALIH